MRAAASATVVVVGGIAVAACATALGIGIGALATNQSYDQACAQIWNSASSSVQSGVTATYDEVTGKTNYIYNSDFAVFVRDRCELKHMQRLMMYSTLCNMSNRRLL